ncbi:MAG: type II toxin-antitoxin system RelE/ParE family toxin [Spirulina sp. SIO3F2]|nr:type II toxin-antitoxin system RelE/ParE family toxin [Spirulina sp. SIO3F2]
MSYQIVIQPAAQRQLKKLPRTVQQDMITVLEQLAHNPRPSGCKKLKGRPNQYRLRLRDYRIIYSIEDMMLIIRVLKAGHRRDIYEN